MNNEHRHLPHDESGPGIFLARFTSRAGGGRQKELGFGRTAACYARQLCMKSLIYLATLAMLSASASADGPVRHVVQFKFKKNTTPEQIQQVVDEFAKLPQKIHVIDTFEWGTNVSTEGLDQGYTHCWLLSFRSEKDRDFYLHHPEHEAFAALAKPLLESAHVVDFIPAKKLRKTFKPKSTLPGSWGAQKTG